MANFFNILNQKIIINSSKISNPSLKDAVILNSERVAGDLSSIATYNNQVVYEVFRKLCSKPQYPFDVVESGISGNTVVTYLEEDGNNRFNSPIYWSEDQNRPNTIKESFDYVMSNLGIQEIIRQNESPDLGNIINQIRCAQKNLNKLRKDTIGCNDDYFSCSEDPELEWPLSKHIYELFTQGIITGHSSGLLSNLDNTCDTSESYPPLSLTIETDDITEGSSLIPQRFIESCEADSNSTLEDELDQIYDFIGMECMENLDELAACNELKIEQQRSLKAYIVKILEKLCSLGEGGVDAVYLGVRNPPAGEERNIENIYSGANDLLLRTGTTLQYHHSSNPENKNHHFRMNGDQALIRSLFVPDTTMKVGKWDSIGENYRNPIPYTLFSYSTNSQLDGIFALINEGNLEAVRQGVPTDSSSFFQEICAYEESGNIIYNYESIGGVIRNDLTICDLEKDTGTGVNKITDELGNYHNYVQTPSEVLNHLQIGGHTPVICLGPVSYGEVLVPAPLELQQILIPGLTKSYGFVCSRKILSENYSGIYGTITDGSSEQNINDLNYKVGISLSSNYSYLRIGGFGDRNIAQQKHEDIVDNIIKKAKSDLNIKKNPVMIGNGSNVAEDIAVSNYYDINGTLVIVNNSSIGSTSESTGETTSSDLGIELIANHFAYLSLQSMRIML